MLDYFLSPAPLEFLLRFFERWSLFIFSKTFGISWNSNAVLNGTATAEDSIKFLACTLIMCHTVTFFTLNLFYESLPLIFSKKTLAPWRAHGERYADRSLINKCILYVTGFHIIVSYLAYNFLIPFAYSANIFGGEGMNLIDTLPASFPRFFGYLVVCLIATEFSFYWGHRALHEIPFAYEYIHKQHHEFIITESWACEYAHPIELVFGNVLPVLFGPLLFRMHPVVWFTWMVLAMYGTISGHSSYWYPSKIYYFHVFHHSHNVGNLGTSGLWDRLCGTNQAWLRYKKIVGADNRAIFQMNNKNIGSATTHKDQGAMMATDPEMIARLSEAVQKQSKSSPKKASNTSTTRSRSSSSASKKKSGSRTRSTSSSSSKKNKRK